MSVIIKAASAVFNLVPLPKLETENLTGEESGWWDYFILNNNPVYMQWHFLVRLTPVKWSFTYLSLKGLFWFRDFLELQDRKKLKAFWEPISLV